MPRRSSAFRVDLDDAEGDRGEGASAPSDLRQLAHLDLNELRRLWLLMVGRSAPKSFRRDLLLRALAYEIQVRQEGGLSAAVKARLRNLTAAAREGRFDEVLGATSLKPGTMLVRLWQGQTHRVMVTRDGYVWNGEQFSSLSTIAKRITGTSWNGWTFFGVKRPKARNKNALKEKLAADAAMIEAACDRARPLPLSSADPALLAELDHA